MLDHLLSLDQRLTLLLNGSQSLYWDTFFMTATSTVVWLPLIAVLLYVLIRNHATHNTLLVVLFAGLAVLLADQLASGICKPYFERLRLRANRPSCTPLKWLTATAADSTVFSPAMRPTRLP